MNVAPEIDAPTRHLYLLKEKEAPYDVGERRPTPGEAAGGERHVRIPYAVLTAGLSPQAVVGYAWLQQHVGDEGCFPSFETLATEMQCSIRAAKARVAELEARRFLAHRRRGLGLSNVYDLYPAGDAPEPKVRRRNPDVQKSARQASEVQKTARPDVQSGVNRSAENCTLTIPSNQTQLTKDAAPTERAAPGPERAAKTVGTPEQPTPTVKATPPERERVPRAKRASADAKPAADAPATPREPTPIQRVEQGIKAAGVKVAMQWGKDGKALAELLAGSDVTTDDVVGCYVAIARGQYGSEYERRNLGVAFVCTKAMAGYLNWKDQGAHPPPRQGRATGPAVSAADGFGAVARRARGEEEDDDQGRDGRVAATTFDGVARPL